MIDSVCEPGNFVTVEPTLTSDRHCQPCLSGYYQNETNQAECYAFSTCPNGWTVFIDGSPSSDVKCAEGNVFFWVQIVFATDWFSIANNATAQIAFSNSIQTAIMNLRSIPITLLVKFSLFQYSPTNDNVVATVTFSEKYGYPFVVNSVYAKTFAIDVQSSGLGDAIVYGEFTSDYGPCDPGFISGFGQKPCTICPQNTYTNVTDDIATECASCPIGTKSPTGSATKSQCGKPFKYLILFISQLMHLQQAHLRRLQRHLTFLLWLGWWWAWRSCLRL